MPTERNKICELVSVKKSLDWVNIYTCGCYFNEVVQIKWKKLNWNEISSLISNNLIERKEKLTFVFVKKFIICCLKKLYSAKKIDVWQNNIYGNEVGV